jgi:hypothetical protein
MRLYDQLPLVLAPYVTTTSRRNFRSDILNTDELGFRHTQAGQSLIDTRSWGAGKGRSLLVGGSFVFGVGVTSDRHTLASALSALTSRSFLNLGVRAANSTQELIATIPFLDDAEAVIVCSGLNNLVIGLKSSGADELFGPIFAERPFQELASYSVAELTSVLQFRVEGIGIRPLVGAAWRRALGRLRSALGRTPEDQAPGLEAAKPGDLQAIAKKALKRQCRDLSILARALPRGCQLLFAVQPCAATRKEISPEEQRLFEITDNLQGSHWHILKAALMELWPWYAGELKDMCVRQGVKAIDLNEVELKGWCYVDRVHMTDSGTLQIARKLAQEIT